MESINNLRDIFSASTILVKVGPMKIAYHVHKSLITRHSAYFCNAVRFGAFVEGETGIVILTDVDPSTFEWFLYWLYSHRIPYVPENFSEALAYLYVFADRFLVPNLKTEIVARAVDLVNKHDLLPTYATIIYAFANLPEQSCFLELLSDAFIKHWTGDDSTEAHLFEVLPPAFLSKVMKRYVTLKKSTNKVLSAANYNKMENCASQVDDKSGEESPSKKRRISLRLSIGEAGGDLNEH